MPVLSDHRTTGPDRPGYPLRGLGWGLLAAVVAALVLFAAMLALDVRGGSATTVRPAAGAALELRVRLSGPAIRLGLQVQSADNGKAGPQVQVLVPAGRWSTLSVPLSALGSPAGVRRVSVIAQGVPTGTEIWIATVVLR